MEGGAPVPGVAPAAKQQGKLCRGDRPGAPAPATPRRGRSATGMTATLATIGKRAAVIDFGWIKLKGWIAWWMWGFAHIYFLIGLRNRLTVVAELAVDLCSAGSAAPG